MPMRPEELKKRFAQADSIVTQLAKRARERVVIDPNVKDGQPCVRGLPVSEVVRMISKEYTVETILGSCPGLTRADVNAALRFAADEVVMRYAAAQRHR